MTSWLDALARTRRNIADAFGKAFASDHPDDVTLEQLEERLLASDVPVRLAGELIQELEESRPRDLGRKEALSRKLVEALAVGRQFDWKSGSAPFSILVVGVNGAGKTTTCAKLAALAMGQGLKTVLGAADTFRAAGSDQLKWWADHIGSGVVGGKTGADAAAVAYDALDAAISRHADVVIIDTAGRMHTREPLMRELQKVRNSMGKRQANAPDEVWIVLDATLGQNAVVQARTFHEAIPLTGAIVSKLDGSSKAGFVFSIVRELNIPIMFAGLGEAKEDLVAFDAEKFVDALLG